MHVDVQKNLDPSDASATDTSFHTPPVFFLTTLKSLVPIQRQLTHQLRQLIPFLWIVDRRSDTLCVNSRLAFPRACVSSVMASVIDNLIVRRLVVPVMILIFIGECMRTTSR